MLRYPYFRTGRGDAHRPVIFVYNGGPGSSSVWLHVGLFAPRRVKLYEPINPPAPPPIELEDNPHSPLDVCDVVMVDPVETGYGRLLDPGAGKQFFGIEQDACALAHFIEGWLTKHNRWDARIYLAGESYGTVRPCILANTLMGGPFSAGQRLLGISVAGIIMLGAHLHTNGYASQEAVEPAVLQLPSMAATAWYHKRDGKPDLAAFVEDAYRFSCAEYLPALFQGSRLGGPELAHAVERLAWFTGIQAGYFRQHGLTLTTGAFAAELLREEGLAVGLYDSRYTLRHVPESSMQDPVGDDPAMGQYSPALWGPCRGR